LSFTSRADCREEFVGVDNATRSLVIQRTVE
jgi:hypothetical protein